MKEDTLLTLMMDCIKAFPKVKAAYKYEHEKTINPAYTDIEHEQPVCLNEKRIWALRSDLTLAVGIKNSLVLSGNTPLLSKIDPNMHRFIRHKDRYGHPSLAMPEKGYDGSVHYAGWFNQYPDCIMVMMSTGRYQNSSLTPFQKQILEHYISIKFMNAYGEQNIIFMDYTTDEAFYLFLQGKLRHENVVKRTYAPNYTKKNSLDLALHYLSIDRLFFNEIEYIKAGIFSDIHLVTESCILPLVKVLVNENPALLNALNCDNNTPLQIATMYGYVEIVQFLITKGADLNIATRMAANNNINEPVRNMTAIDLAFHNNEYEIMTLLLDAGAKISPAMNCQVHYIHVVAKLGLLKQLKVMLDADFELLEAFDDLGQTPLLWAAAEGHCDIVDYLIAQGADVNVRTQLLPYEHIDNKCHNYSPLDWAIDHGHAATVTSLIKAGSIARHTHRAFNGKSVGDMVIAGNLEGIRILINHNKALLNEVDDNGNTPLLLAVWFSQAEIVYYLISEKADLNIGTSIWCDGIALEVTPLELALLKHNHLIAIILNTAGARTSPALNGQFHAIHLFAKQGWLSHMKMLLENNPKLLTVVDHENKTPLLWADLEGYHEIVDYLMHQEVWMLTRVPMI